MEENCVQCYTISNCVTKAERQDQPQTVSLYVTALHGSTSSKLSPKNWVSRTQKINPPPPPQLSKIYTESKTKYITRYTGSTTEEDV